MEPLNNINVFAPHCATKWYHNGVRKLINGAAAALICTACAMVSAASAAPGARAGGFGGDGAPLLGQREAGGRLYRLGIHSLALLRGIDKSRQP
jgi:hypothetical protein